MRTRALLRQARRTAAEIDRWALQARQLVIIDEASMAGTLELDQTTTLARDAGARVLLVGGLDPALAGLGRGSVQAARHRP